MRFFKLFRILGKLDNIMAAYMEFAAFNERLQTAVAAEKGINLKANEAKALYKFVSKLQDLLS